MYVVIRIKIRGRKEKEMAQKVKSENITETVEHFKII